VGFSLSRNYTFDRIVAGALKNIRMHTADMNQIWPENITTGKFDPWIGYPPKGYVGAAFDYVGGGWLLPSVGGYPDGAAINGHFINNTVGSFSAACWHFAEALTEMAEARNETAVPYGLISTSWGGTVIEVWTPDSVLAEGKCRCGRDDGAIFLGFARAAADDAFMMRAATRAGRPRATARR
jgi:hypothetical protein